MMKFFLFLRLVISDRFKIMRLRKLGLPPDFKTGIYLYVGLPGRGKTISIVKKLDEIRATYPDALIVTNFGYKYEHASLTSWKQLVNLKNGASGIVFAIDEVQLTFNSRAWKDFPPDMVTLLTQNRKERKLILTSAQSYDRVDKVFRELTNYVVRCRTIGGRWTFNRAFLREEYEAFVSGYGKSGRKAVTSWRFSFIQTDELRSQYDTFKILTRLSDLAVAGDLVRGLISDVPDSN